MANIKLVGALLIVVAIDLFMFFGQQASAAVAAADPGYDGSTFLHGNTTWTGGGNVTIGLPSQASVEGSDGSIVFTDQISSSKSWITSAGETFVRITGGPVNYVKALNLPSGFTVGIAAFWYILTAFLIGAFILGRE